MLHRSIIVTTILLNTFVICFATGNPIVTTPSGIIEGYWTKTVNNRSYAAFDGIPYAVPPVRKYRFQEPQPVKPWVGVWKADVEYKCIQYNHYTEPNEDFIIGNEDCLYINVYTPEVNKMKIYDVIVYIHGGAFMFGSSAVYGHKYILDRDLIYVSLNYRLGPLGFLSTEDIVLPGNYGLKDQLLALKWIKENIRYFGGNPESITLTGMSAGGASVHIHYMSSLSQGLFHRGIIQSGTALNNWVLVENSLEKAKRLGSLVGCEFENSTAFIGCLQTRSARQIVGSVKHFLGWLYNPFSPFGVVIDKISTNAILPEHPLELIKKNKFEKLPLIFSCVQSEGLYPAADFLREPDLLDKLNQHWNKLMPYVLDFNYTVPPNNQNDVSKKIRQFYFTITKAPIYFYYFSYRGAHSKSETRSKTNENFGASHGVYVLSSNVNVRTSSSDIQMSDTLLNMWSDYARTSQPKFIGFEDWKPVEKDMGLYLRYMHIVTSENIKIKTIESLGNRKFWHSVGFLENENLLNVK